MIPRALENELHERLKSGREAVVLFGARQVGKTTLVRRVLSTLPYRVLSISADEQQYPDALSSRNLDQLRALTTGYDLIFIDEAQRIPEVGINLKLMVDQLPDLRIIATGSSSLDLASKTRESLAGRAWNYTLYPIAQMELAQQHNPYELAQMLPARMIYGAYPRIVEMVGDVERRSYLDNLAASYLYKDLLEIARIRYSNQLRNLLRLLAFQIGQPVSFTELGTQLGMSKNTVADYVNLLEQSFIIFKLGGYSRNLRKEVSKQEKVYFWDLGVRNVLIGNFAPLNQRNDVGQLWENFVIAERYKLLRYKQASAQLYYWRTNTGAELDFVEERDGRLYGYECKWGQAKARMPQTFLDTYPESEFALINPENFAQYLVA